MLGLFCFRVRNITYYERKWLYADYNDSSNSSNDIIGNTISIGRRTLSINYAGVNPTNSYSIIRRKHYIASYWRNSNNSIYHEEKKKQEKGKGLVMSLLLLF